MAYLVLARRWRPQRFEEVIGQRHVTQTLQNAISIDRVAHAFLFSGARGVGKTTVARILAKALNCREGPTPHPCGQCDSCQEITGGVSMDVREIDGASNTGVDDVRDLRERLGYRPTKGRFRVYIIDEVHMLSNAAFNALLKTLEEPPPHVVFIFATTEPHKIPMTILSRCQRFDFRRIPLMEIANQLERIGQTEGIQVARDTLILIAREAQGSLRDAQSLLDQVISYAGSHITSEAVQEVLGLLERRWLFSTSEALIQRDAGGCLEVVEELFQRGYSLTYFYHQLVEHLRNLMLVHVDPRASDILHLPDHELKELQGQAQRISAEDLQLWFDILVRAEEEVRRSQYPRYLMEMLLVKMAHLDRTHDLEDLVSRIHAFCPGQGSFSSGDAEESLAKEQSAPSDREAQVRAPTGSTWTEFLEHVRNQRPALASVLEQGRFLECAGGETVRIAFPNAFHVERINEAEQADVLQILCGGFFGRGVRIVPVLDGQGAPSREGHVRNKNHQMRAGIRAHPLVQEALEVFGGRIMEIRLPNQGTQTHLAGASQGEDKEVDGERTG